MKIGEGDGPSGGQFIPWVGRWLGLIFLKSKIVQL